MPIVSKYPGPISMSVSNRAPSTPVAGNGGTNREPRMLRLNTGTSVNETESTAGSDRSASSVGIRAQDALKETGRGATGGGGWMRRAIVVTEGLRYDYGTILAADLS